MKTIKVSLSFLLFGILSSIPLSGIAKTSVKNEKIISVLEDEKQNDNFYRVYFPNETLGNKLAITFHSQLRATFKDKGYSVLELSEKDIERLKPFGFKIVKAHEFIRQEKQRLEGLQQQLRQKQNLLEQSAIPGYDCYETVEETFATAESMVTDFPQLASWIDVGDSWEKSTGQGGYDIKVLVLTNQNNAFEKPKLFINSAIHAREYTTAPLNLDFARWLVEGYATNADARWILDYHEVHLMLQTNPDGRKMAEGGSSWRKNTNQNFCGATSSRRGADLNRNFSDRWNITNGRGSSGWECSDTYRGPSAGSEPEIQAIENYIRSIFPDQRGPNDDDAAPLTATGMHIDIHSYSELVLWPWGDSDEPAPNGSQLQALGRKFAFFNGYMPQQSIGLYATDGTSDGVSYSELGVPAITFELGTSFFQRCSTYENTIKPNNLPALIYAAKVVNAPYVTPSGPDTLQVSLSDNASTDGVPAGIAVTLTANTSDLRFSNRNGTEPTQNIASAEYYIDVPPWQSGATAIPLTAADGSFNAKQESVTGTIDTSNLSVGEHIIFVRAKDTSNIFGAVSAVFLQINNEEPPLLDFSYDCNGLVCSFQALTNGTVADYQWDFGDGNSGSGQQISYEYSSGGTYSVTLIVTDAQGNSDSLSKAINVSGVDDSSLENGIPKADLSAAQGEEIRYLMNVPPDARNLSFVIKGGTGDADLYVRFGAEPTTSEYDCRPYRNGNSEVCTIDNIQTGTYYVMLRAYRDFRGVSLTGSYDVGPIDDGSFEELNVSGAQGEWKHYQIDLPAGTSLLKVSIEGGTGDADLYVRQGSEPTTNQYECRPYRWGNNESCSFNNPGAGTWFISLRGYSEFSGVNIRASWSDN
ncbi:M14 family zinc carboxypeptidase [Pleionea sediminis]|uniref:M14 family zinc carboxypeptidase n=1 Tax=Pleionea sediminis TaxID=2569479 RepID=UPI0013DDB654|nr:M14 family zinc carboxypeptidase [Pleionea sediminis]